MATTDLDFQQSAVRERLDKFSRHVHQHRRAETLVGRKINPALRRPTTTTIPSPLLPPASSSAETGSRTNATTVRDNYTIGAGEVISGEEAEAAAAAAAVVVVGAALGSSQQQPLQQIQQLLGAGADAATIEVDAEAEAICNALDGLGDGATASACPLLLERSSELEW